MTDADYDGPWYEHEPLIPLAEAARVASKWTRVHITRASTYAWAFRGLNLRGRGMVKLEITPHGGRILTSENALARFLHAVSMHHDRHYGDRAAGDNSEASPIAHETLVTLRSAAAKLPVKTPYKTVVGWASRGVHGVRLQTVRVAGRVYTSVEAFARFRDQIAGLIN